MTYNTESHKKILDFLKQNKEKSFSAEEILAHVSQNGAAKSTVFRQLAKLSQNSEIKRIASASNRSVRYQFIDREHCSEHLHLKCSSCGRLIHLDDELTHFFEEKIKNSKSFSIDMSAFIPGICDGCIAKGGTI